MPAVKLRDAAGAEHGSLDLDDAIFGIEPNEAVMHQVVTAQLAARRAGTQSTQTRAEVRGGGAKPWKQKGTGRARQGSIRAPQWRGGGVALGPKPRSYAQRTPKKMIRLALRSALSDRATENKVVVVDAWGWDAPSTRSAAEALTALGVDGRIAVVVSPDDAPAIKSFRNLPYVHLLLPGELNAYDVLVSDYVVFTRDTLPSADAAPEAAEPKVTKAAAAKPAARPAKKANPAAPEATRAVISDSEGDDDMASDLPNRPKNTGEVAKPVDPAERVKPAGEKTDPRFEAARIKAEKEAEVRAAREQAASAPAEEPDEAATDEAADGAEPAKPSGGFSFNQTVESDEDAT
ncbi:MAG TPA: 50S ribosomal protein L4 [Acidimicrobiales bacterium]|nr:50S ribosomal protein L4 [Acidimicrobiales bacterium]